jgi:hypothetical protein
MPTPEQLARQNIDDLLDKCGWIVQSRAEMNLGAGRGIAVREFPLKTGFADYLLFVDRRAIGAIERSRKARLTGVEAQTEVQRGFIRDAARVAFAAALPLRVPVSDVLHQRTRSNRAAAARCVPSTGDTGGWARGAIGAGALASCRR